MQTYKYSIKMEVEVEAFEDSDAFDIIQEAFAVGYTGAVLVTDCEYSEKLSKRKK